MSERCKVSAEEAKERQAKRDREYLAACAEHGIEAVAASYRAGRDAYAGSAANDVALGFRQTSLDAGAHTHFDYDAIDRNLEKAESSSDEDCDVALSIHPEAEAVLSWVLDIAIPDKRRFCQRAISGRLIALCWLLERGDIGGMSQTAIADRLEMTRSNFSNSVRQIQKAIGGSWKARGQKSEIANKKYRAIRNAAVAAGNGNLKGKRKLID
jgi:hypothetical protein